MKNLSNTPFPTVPQPWKTGEWAIYINHTDNGVQEEEMEGSRYEADFTIVKELSAEAAIKAFTRQQEDPDLDVAVITTIEVDGKYALDVEREHPESVSPDIFPALPETGTLKKGEIYSYNNGAVMVVQDHDRTIYAPGLTPALFSFYRTVKEGLEWIPGEKVETGETRVYNGKTYVCLQSHQTQEAWTPELTIGVLWSVKATTSEWAVGVAYKVKDVVTYNGKTYECLQAHTSQAGWTPEAVPALWKLI